MDLILDEFLPSLSGMGLGVCERGFSRVSLFFESPLGRFICVQIGVMYT